MSIVTRISQNGWIMVSMRHACEGSKRRPYDLLKSKVAKDLKVYIAKRYNLSESEIIEPGVNDTWVHVCLINGISTSISFEFSLLTMDLLLQMQPPSSPPTLEAQTKEIVLDDLRLQQVEKPENQSWSGKWHNGFPVFRYGLTLRSEDDLHFSVVRFARERCPDLLLVPTLGEIGALSEDMRKVLHSRGYTKGSPDILVLAPPPHNGKLAIEFKAPCRGIHPEDAEHALATEQKQAHTSFEKAGWTVITSSNLFDIIQLLHDMQQEVGNLKKLLVSNFRISDSHILVEKNNEYAIWRFDTSSSTTKLNWKTLHRIEGSTVDLLASAFWTRKRPFPQSCISNATTTEASD